MNSVENSTAIDIGDGNFEYDVSIISDWNLVGLSVNIVWPAHLSVFPTIVEESLYGYSDSYFLTDALVPGSGYWLRFDEGNSVTVSGNIINDLILSLTEGWNLIAGPSGDVSISLAYDPDSLIVPNTMFGYNTTGYTETDVLSPGYGYWIRSFGEGEVSLSSERDGNYSSPPILDKKQTNMNSISINGKKLYFGSSSMPLKERLSFSLPPKPLAKAKDIRFSNNSRLCLSGDCIVEVMNNDEPLYFECNIMDGDMWKIVDENGNAFNCSDVQLLEFASDVERIFLKKSIDLTPDLFSISPAYPNPFNPVTNIEINIPELSSVNVSIYNIQGQLVETLINKSLQAGNHHILWNGKSFPSGVYFLAMNSSDFSQVEKLMLVK